MNCANCNREIAIGERAFVLFFFFQTRGTKPRTKSHADSLALCVGCQAKIQAGEQPQVGFLGRFRLRLLVILRAFPAAQEALARPGDGASAEVRS